MSKRHQHHDYFLSQIRRCQELILASTGIDEFYEITRLLLAKSLWEQSGSKTPLTYSHAQSLLNRHQTVVQRFVEGDIQLNAPANVADECLRILSSTPLQSTSYDILHTAFEQMTGKYYKSDKGQYFTPSHIVDFCMDVLRPQTHELICDPACGSGAFLKSAYEKLPTNHETIFGFDISRRATKSAALLSYLTCNDNINIHQLDALTPENHILLDSRYDSIETIIQKKINKFSGFDIIATNPPFAGDVADAHFLHYYKTPTLSSSKIERDVLFLERCLRLLKPNGRLAIILPDNKFSGSRFASLREWLTENMKIIAVVSLHSYTFRPFTSQKACILFAVRDENGTCNNSIQFYRSDKPGKSSSGTPIMTNTGMIDHDLTEIAQHLKKEWYIG